MERPVSLLGCGWLGIPLAQKLISRGHSVWGTTTRSERLSILTSLGVNAVLLRIDGDEAVALKQDRIKELLSSPTLILSLPPSSALGPDFHKNQLASIVTSLPSPKATHLIYVSSVSVYGENQGAVDETTPPVPSRESGEVQLSGENFLRVAAIERGFALTIVRAGGLIGPGRHPGLFLQGRKDVKDPYALVNLVHQDDLAESIAILVDKTSPAAGEAKVFNAVSKSHPTRKEFYTKVSELIGVPPPVFAEMQTSNPKSVSSESLRSFTGHEFRFDDLYSALTATSK